MLANDDTNGFHSNSPADISYLFRFRVRRGGKGDRRLGVDDGLFLSCCRGHSGSRSRAHRRADQCSLSTARDSADEGARSGAATDLRHIALGMALSFGTESTA